jgi:DNA repair protein RadC
MNVQYVSIKLVREKTMKYREKISNSMICRDLVESLLADSDREKMIVVCVDCKLYPTAINTAHVGTATESIVSAREIFKPAILSNATGIFLAHNHPSGDPTPSYEDRNLTESVVKAGRILNIRVIDHIIIGDGSYWSVADFEPDLLKVKD